MKMKQIFNPRTIRLFGWSTLFTVVFGIVLYVVVGVINVPSESPLADPDYVLRELNDVTIPWDAELPPDTITPINMLNNGEPIITPSVIVVLTIASLIMLLGLSVKSDFYGISLLIPGQIYFVTEVISVIINIPFVYDLLRSGAQPLIDGSHRLRVVFAYIMLWCERYDVIEADVLVKRCYTIVMILSYALAGAIEYLRWKHKKQRKEATSENRPAI